MVRVIGSRQINEYGIRVAIAKTYGCNIDKIEFEICDGELCAELPAGNNLAFADEDDGK